MKQYPSFLQLTAKISHQLHHRGKYRVLLMDPPWNDTGIKHPYPTMDNATWMSTIRVDDLVGDGFVFVWVTNRQYFPTMQWMDKQGWEPIEHITWKKVDGEGRPRRKSGHYLWHAKETCLMFHRK